MSEGVPERKKRITDIYRNIIFGHYWLEQNGARSYFNLYALRPGDEYVALEEDRHILSISRSVALKPHAQVFGKSRITGRRINEL